MNDRDDYTVLVGMPSVRITIGDPDTLIAIEEIPVCPLSNLEAPVPS